MEDKKQDVNSLEELVKTADSYRALLIYIMRYQKYWLVLKCLKKRKIHGK